MLLLILAQSNVIVAATQLEHLDWTLQRGFFIECMLWNESWFVL